MGNFWQGLKCGFGAGMLQNMFGCFMPFCGYNPWQFNSRPFFGVPMFMGNFYQYQQPTGIFMPDLSNISINYNESVFGGFSAPMNWSLTGLDTYQSKTSNTTNSSNPAKPINYDAEALMAKWSKKNSRVTQEFCNKVVQIAQNIKCDPDDLMGIMSHESGFNPQKVNNTNRKKNVGLIQFCADARHDMKVPGADNSRKSDDDWEATYNAMLNMSALEQLDYVEKYYLGAKRNSGIGRDEVVSTATLAALAFASSRAKEEVLAVQGSAEYDRNKNLDTDGDGKITKTELGRRIESYKA